MSKFKVSFELSLFIDDVCDGLARVECHRTEWGEVKCSLFWVGADREEYVGYFIAADEDLVRAAASLAPQLAYEDPGLSS